VRVGVFVFGSVEMDGLGTDIDPTTRTTSPKEIQHATERIIDLAVLADRLGFDSFWTTEHHFQHEGYEVVPNALMLGAFIAERTTRLRIGSMFNIVAQWHPLRLAEDFATLHNLSGGRAILGVGRGTVPRETQPLSSGRVSVGSADNPDQAQADAVNRQVTEEALDLLDAALGDERFCHRGVHFQAPPRGIPDRGGEVETLTLVPRPIHPYDVWQAVTSPPTLETVAARGYGAVFWLLNRSILCERWMHFDERYAATHGRRLDPGERRMAVLNVHIADSPEQALAEARPGHDEFWKFLGPYGWGRGYLTPEGTPAPAGWVPTLEQSVAQGTWVVGTAEHVGDEILRLRDQLDATDVTIFPSMPGDTYDRAEDQLRRFAQDVLPRLDSPADIVEVA
jgi:alkanesulfonate monooxygenase SsuD/methylene tetrahydromethanopterin reductase-like flavin-dependent oxidoreductase (luciferase family)